jgi:hypothetical protein
MAKRTVKYTRMLKETIGANKSDAWEPEMRKSKKVYLENGRESRKKPTKLGGVGSRKIRRNIIRNLDGYKTKYMAESWRNNQTQIYGPDKYAYLKGLCQRKSADLPASKWAVRMYRKLLTLHKLYKKVV